MKDKLKRFWGVICAHIKSNKAMSVTIGVLLVVLVALLLWIPYLERVQSEAQATLPAPSVEAEPSSVPDEPTTVPSQPEPVTEPTVPGPTEPLMLSYLAPLAEQNKDMVGWIKIEGTKVNYPLMYTPENDEKYIRKNFEGKYSVAGLPFIEGNCSWDPRSDNLIIYGHNMKNGTMFASVMDYKDEEFWREHPVIHLYDLYSETAYEVFAAFYDRVYYTHEKNFKFYKFVDAEDEADFDYAIKQFKKKSCYDTGITPQYGDQLITLVTCSYHTDNGRFVVVARAVPKEDSAPQETLEP